MTLVWLFLSNVGRRLHEWADARIEKREPRPIIEIVKDAWS